MRLGIAFVDMDEAIVSRAGKSIPDIFDQDGEPWFRMLERSELHRTAHLSEAVIATGGGTPIFYDNARWMLGQGRCYYLELPIDVLAQRIKRRPGSRPLLDRPDWYNHLGDTLLARSAYYRQAHVILPRSEQRIGRLPAAMHSGAY